MNAIAGMTTIAKTSLDHREKVLDCLNKIERSNQYLLALSMTYWRFQGLKAAKLKLVQSGWIW